MIKNDFLMNQSKKIIQSEEYEILIAKCKTRAIKRMEFLLRKSPKPKPKTKIEH